ncbi:MAG: hypothetical protein ACFFDI_27690 [Promethearchaeota archaeon]
MKSEIVVYYDQTYPSSYIDAKMGYPTKIATHLKSKGISNINATSLRDFIESSLNERNANNKIVVFSQDIVPDTICEEEHSNTLLREYLDAGGNIVWMGDIPLFNIGKKTENDQISLIPAYTNGAPVYMLGIIPLYVSTLRSINFESLGRALGLTHHWTSTRPVLKDNTIKPLAVTENIGADYYVNVPKKKTKCDKIIDWLKRTKSVKFTGFEFEREPTEEEKPKKDKVSRHTLYETHPSAWVKNFNEEFPNCGFYRIWDYCPRIMPYWMIDELFNFVQGIARRIEREN